MTDEEIALLKSTFSVGVASANATDVVRTRSSDHPHAHLSAPEVVALYNYGIESHMIKTEDNYFLTVHRITGNSKNPNPEGKRVVFLQHGLLSSSMDWVIAGPRRGLAFLLADAGYDVWMGNARGNRYSRSHKFLSIKDPEYWQFDWHEIGSRDLPAMIDHVLNVTKREKLFYIGHSQGSTAFFVMASELPEYNDKINAMFALAPVAHCGRMKSPIFQALSRILKPLSFLTNIMGAYEFKPTNQFVKRFTSFICGSFLQPICSNVIFMIAGFNPEQLDTELLPAILAHVPAGAAVKQFIHYGQLIKTRSFRQFDHGRSMNMEQYKSRIPPDYNITKVTAPVSLHYTVNDWLSHPSDVDLLYSQLPNPIVKLRVPNDKFNHLDHLWAKDVKKLLYDKVMSLMKRY
ncbi:lipase 3-like [Phymastichus coffea]|uniref:lipase 3-like n=1 Tax=Phymastichus coffea TaxID=108790 RepID=UPI00273CC319|nr:lipase 3-like [Phymastichus coffea]